MHNSCHICNVPPFIYLIFKDVTHLGFCVCVGACARVCHGHCPTPPWLTSNSFWKMGRRSVCRGVGRYLCAVLFALYFVMTNGSYLFLLKLFLNTNEVIYVQKHPWFGVGIFFSNTHLFHFSVWELLDSIWTSDPQYDCSKSKMENRSCLIESSIKVCKNKSQKCAACHNATKTRQVGMYFCWPDMAGRKAFSN